jgi:hypothetical protein
VSGCDFDVDLISGRKRDALKALVAIHQRNKYQHIIGDGLIAEEVQVALFWCVYSNRCAVHTRRAKYEYKESDDGDGESIDRYCYICYSFW